MALLFWRLVSSDFAQFWRNFPQFRRIFPQFRRNFLNRQLKSIPAATRVLFSLSLSVLIPAVFADSGKFLCLRLKFDAFQIPSSEIDSLQKAKRGKLTRY